MIEFNVRSFYDARIIQKRDSSLNTEVVLRTTCHKEESNFNFAPTIRATYTGYGEYSLITLPKVMKCHYKTPQTF